MTTDFPPVVTANWLQEHHHEVAIADVRWYLDGRSGEAAYLSGHIPGAVWVDVDTVLSSAPDPVAGRHPLPEASAFAGALGRLGFADDVPVIAYDDAGGAFAARLVWLLRIIGQPAAILSGGIAAWPGDQETTQPERVPTVRNVVKWPADRFATADEVEHARDAETIVIDARDFDRYTGEKVLASDIRSGHIPGARSAPWTANLGDGREFLGTDQLRSRFTELGIHPGDGVIAYCGSGVTACHDLLALEAAGIAGARLYPGSWSAWSADLGRPIEVGPDAGRSDTVR